MARKYHKIKYPKLLLLITTIIIAGLIFYEFKNYESFQNIFFSLGYIGIFLGGIFYAYGFTAAPATAVLLILAGDYDLSTSVLIGGLGAVISDFLIFNFIRLSFKDEISLLKKEKIIKSINSNGKNLFGHYYKYVFPVFAGFLIASPLPTEIGVTMIAGIKKISLKKFIILAYIMHSIGILIILRIGNMI